MPDEIIIRPSATTSYLDCARRAAATLFSRMIRNAGFELRQLPRNVGAAVGTGVHKGAWYTLDQKMRTGGLGLESDAVELGTVAFREEIVDGVMWDTATMGPNEADKQIQRMTRIYRSRIAPEVTPVSIEERLEARIGDVIVSGQKDVLTREPSDLRDLKTGAASRASHAAQLGAYSLIETSHGREVTGLKEDYVPRASLRKPQPDPTTLTYDIGTCENLAYEVIERIQSDVAEFQRRIETGERPPENAFQPNPSSVLCSDKYCPAWGTKFCMAHRPQG